MLAGSLMSAGPAFPGPVSLRQPDGSVFTAYLTGDEFMKITRTEDGGFAVMQDEDGWWCYAVFNPDGTRHSSGVRVGVPASPQVLEAGQSIPWTVLSANARKKREAFALKDEKPAIGRLAGHSGGSATKSESSPGKKHGIAILVQYRDDDGKFKYSRQDFLNLLNSPGYNGTGSAVDYFNDQFKGAAEFSFDVSEIVTLPREKAYYGANDSNGDDRRPAEMIYEACRLADESVDFSLYDNDRDGYVDNVFVFFAGKDEASGGGDNCIWSHAWDLQSAAVFGDGNGAYVSADGVKVSRYACTSELRSNGTLTGIGTFCHEYSHTLGLPDLYDTDYDENGRAAAMWEKTSIMDCGNYNGSGECPPNFNCIEREIAGISVPVDASDGEYVLSPVQNSGECLRLGTETEGEYFLIECRDAKGWDKYIGGSGLLVYHIDKTDMTAWTIKNVVNADASHQMADLIEADGRPDRIDLMAGAEYRNLLKNIPAIFFPQGSEILSADTHGTSFKSWDGSPGQWILSNIRIADDGSVIFYLGSDTERIPKARNITADAFPDAAIVSWESDFATVSPAHATLTETLSGKTFAVETAPWDGKKYSATFEHLVPGTSYRLEIKYVAANGEEGEPAACSFATPRSAGVGYPYIYMTNNAIFPSGARMPLRVIDAGETESVSWELDGTGIAPSADGYFHPESGTHELKCSVTFPDGSKDIITRKITVR